MKRLLFIFACLMLVPLAMAQNPSYLSFDPFYFTTNGVPPHRIGLNYPHRPGSPDLPGDIAWSISTNVLTAQYWTQDPITGYLTPKSATSVGATNLFRFGDGRNMNTESWLSKSIILSLGSNAVPSGVYSLLDLISPSKDPTQVQVYLNKGVFSGQFLEVHNRTNAVPSQGAFTLTNNSPIPDSGIGGVVHTLGDEPWISTNGINARFFFDGVDWWESTRWSDANRSVFSTNIIESVNVYSNLQFFAGPVTFTNVITIGGTTVTGDTLWTTNIVGGVTNLQPANLALQPMVGIGWNVGTNTTSWSAENVLSSTTIKQLDGLSGRQIDITATADTNFAFYGEAQLRAELYTGNTNWPHGSLFLNSSTNDGVGQKTASWAIVASKSTEGGQKSYLAYVDEAVQKMLLSPNAPGTPYLLDTTVPHLTGNLLEVGNNGTTNLSLSFDGHAKARRFLATPSDSDTPGSTNGVIAYSSGLVVADAPGINAAIYPDVYGFDARNETAATAGQPNQYSPGLWFKGSSWDGAAARDVGFGMALITISPTASDSFLQFHGSTNNWSTYFTNFNVKIKSGWDGSGTHALTDDGTYKTLGGGSGALGTFDTLLSATNYPFIPAKTYLVFLGDSITSGTPTTTTNVYPWLLTNSFDAWKGFKFCTNAASSGDTFNGQTNTFWTSVFPLLPSSVSTGTNVLVSLLIGANDLGGTNAADYFASVSNFVSQIHGHGYKIVLCNPMLAANWESAGNAGSSNLFLLTDLYKRATNLLDYYVDFLSLLPDNKNLEVFANDGLYLHPNSTGHALMAAAWDAAVRFPKYRIPSFTTFNREGDNWILRNHVGSELWRLNTNSYISTFRIGDPGTNIYGASTIAVIAASTAGNTALTLQASSDATTQDLLLCRQYDGTAAFRVKADKSVSGYGNWGISGTLDIFSGSTGDTLLQLENVAGSGRIYYFGSRNDGSLRIKDHTANVDRLWMDSAGKTAIGADTPTSTLHVQGSFARSVAVGAGATLGDTNDIYLINVDSQTVTNETAVGHRGRCRIFKTISPAATATVTNTASQLIDGATSYSLTASNKFVSMVSDGTNWWIIGNN